jgi:hypothetical protein
MPKSTRQKTNVPTIAQTIDPGELWGAGAEETGGSVLAEEPVWIALPQSGQEPVSASASVIGDRHCAQRMSAIFISSVMMMMMMMMV